MSLEVDIEEMSPISSEYLVPYFGMEKYLERIGRKIDLKQRTNEVDPEIRHKLLRAVVGMGIIQGSEIVGAGLGLYYIISKLTM